eukprot:GHVS01071640.1.p1 GENE.GHVS01071640.1~~GHVS01071640.1.p1  ORF type:complete len:412 (+),score=37.72 GHVS01071640.1:191-1426(+)
MKMRGMLLLCVSAVLAFCCQICHSQTPEDNVRQTTRVVWMYHTDGLKDSSRTHNIDTPDIFNTPINPSLELELVWRLIRNKNMRRYTMAMIVDKSVYPTKTTSGGRGRPDVNVYNGFSGEFKMNDQIVTVVLYRFQPLLLTANKTKLIPAVTEIPGNTAVSYNWPIPQELEGNHFIWRREVQPFEGSVGKFYRLTFHVKAGTETPGNTEAVDRTTFNDCKVDVKVMDKDVYEWLRRNRERYSIYAEVHCFGDKANRFLIGQRCRKGGGGLCVLHQLVGKAPDVKGDLASRKRKPSKGSDADAKRPKKMPRVESGKTKKTEEHEEPPYLDNVNGLSTSDGYMLLTFTIGKSQISVEPVGVIVQKSITKYQLLIGDSHLKDIIDAVSIKCCPAFANVAHFNDLISLPPLAEGA